MFKKISLILPLILGTQFFFSNTAMAEDFQDPASVGWKFRYNQSSNNFSNTWKKYKKDGYIPIDLETDKLGGVKYSGVWQKNTDGRGWRSYRNLTSSQFGERWKEWKDKGYRPIDIDTEVINGKLRYSLVMVRNKEGLKWASNRNLTGAQFSEKFNARKNSYKPVDIDAVEVNGTMRYSVIWLENKPRKGWYLHRNMTPAAYGQKFRKYRNQGYRVADLDCYRRNGKLTYTAIWEKNQAGRGWAAYREMSSQGFRNKWKENNDKGMRIVDIEICPAKNGNGVQYAAVWRENSARYDWKGRTDAQKELTDFLSNNNAPSISAVVISKGKVVFRSGSGFADREKNIKAHSGTVYRSASISKAITGVLGFDMQDAGIINLNQRTDTIIPSLASQHNHTVLQLLQNTGCISHYSGVPGNENSDQTQYASARTTLSDKQNGVLQSNSAVYSPCTAGNNYRYSTHGYTIAAAALEARGGRNFSVLLRQRISSPLGLSSLRAETRTSGASSGDLAKLYSNGVNGTYTAVSNSAFQNNSWKWGGGGIQSSPLDLARFGNALLDNRLFPKSVRDQMWSGSSTRASYAAGWDTNSTSTPTLVRKAGSQQGSLAHIRIDVDDDIVVVAMTNSSVSGAPASIMSGLTSDLMTIAQANP